MQLLSNCSYGSLIRMITAQQHNNIDPSLYPWSTPEFFILKTLDIKMIKMKLNIKNYQNHILKLIHVTIDEYWS